MQSETIGFATMCGMPSSAMVRNQRIMIGPKTVPRPPVPRCCMTNSAIRMTTVIGTTKGSNTCVATPSPSTALSTEMAGVIMPSPYSSAAPNRPDRHQRRMRAPPALGADQRDQRQDAAFPAVVGPHHEQQVLDRDGDDERPEDQREDTDDVLRATPESHARPRSTRAARRADSCRCRRRRHRVQRGSGMRRGTVLVGSMWKLRCPC